MSNDYWFVSFWLARFLEFLGIYSTIEASQASCGTPEVKDKKRVGSSPRARQAPETDHGHHRETVSSRTGNPIDAGEVGKDLALSE